MEVYAFYTQDVEEKLYEILRALKVLSFVVAGLRTDELIDDDDLCGFENVIRGAVLNSQELIEGLQPVWFQESGKIALILGEVE